MHNYIYTHNYIYNYKHIFKMIWIHDLCQVDPQHSSILQSTHGSPWAGDCNKLERPTEDRRLGPLGLVGVSRMQGASWCTFSQKSQIEKALDQQRCC